MESFHPFDSRMDASRDGLLLFIARYGDRDALIVWDLEREQGPGPLPVPRAGVAALAPVDARRQEHRGQRPLGERRLRPLPRPPARGHARAAHRRSLPGSRSHAGPRRAAHRLRLRPRRRRPATARPISYLLDLDSARVAPLTAGTWKDEAPAWAAGRTDLLHLRPRRRAQRLLGGHAGRRPAGDLGVERRVRRRAAARRLRPAGRRLPRSELESVSLSGGHDGPEGAVRARRERHRRPLGAGWPRATPPAA